MFGKYIEQLGAGADEIVDAIAKDLAATEQRFPGLSADEQRALANETVDSFLEAAEGDRDRFSAWCGARGDRLTKRGWGPVDFVAFGGVVRRHLVEAAIAAGGDQDEGAGEVLRRLVELSGELELIWTGLAPAQPQDQTNGTENAGDLLASIPDGVGMADLDGRLVFANLAMRRMFGRESISGLVLTDIFKNGAISPDEVTRIVLREGVWEGVLPMTLADGAKRYGRLKVFPVKDAGGQVRGTAALVRDVTAEHEIESALREAIDHLPSIMYVKGVDNRYMIVNRYAASVMSAEPEDIVGRPDTELFPAEVIREWRGREDRAKRTGAPINYEDEFDVGNETRSFLGTLVPLFDSAGKLYAYAGISTDVTDLKRSEKERARLQQELLLSHKAALRELATPIIPITDEVVVMPLIGPIDSNRAKDVQRKLIEGIVEYQATFAILDLTGVTIVDSMVAGSLIKAAQSARLLGATVLLTGIKPQVAQVMVQLGIDLQDVVTLGSLKSGIAYAMRSLSDE